MHAIVSYTCVKGYIESAEQSGLSGVEGLLAVVGLEMTTEGVRTGTGTER